MEKAGLEYNLLFQVSFLMTECNFCVNPRVNDFCFFPEPLTLMFAMLVFASAFVLIQM